MANRKPLHEFERILAVQHWILKRLGLDVFEQDYRRSTATYVTLFLASFFIAITAYDLYRFRDDVFNLAFALVTLSYGVTGCTRLGYFLGHPVTYARMLTEAKATYRKDLSERARQVQLRYTRLLRQCTTFYGILFNVGCLMAATLPLAIYWWNGLKVLPFGVILPFTDPDTVEGYQLNYLYQASCIVWTPPGLTATQNMYFAFVFNICIQYDVLQLKLEELDEAIVDKVEYSTIRKKLVEVIHYQQRLIAFVTEVEQIFAIQMFIEVSSIAAQIILIMFVEHIDFWFPGYVAIFVATFQLLIFCILGTMISIKSDLFAKTVYNVSWHQIRVPEQKILKLMLAKSQHPTLLTFGRMLPLDMNLFLSVYRKIYSIFMMLQNV